MGEKTKRRSVALVMIAMSVLLGIACSYRVAQRPRLERLERAWEKREAKQVPNDWWFFQRAYGLGNINHEAYREAVERAEELRDRAAGRDVPTVSWTLAGPTNIGGRITALGIHPAHPNTIYAGAATGGVWKSTDGGVDWDPIFDENPSLPIGAITIDPTDPDLVYVGTGEANASGDSYPGDGVYRTTDGGDSWIHLGLEESSHIGRIAINPDDTDILFVAATGQLFDTNPERGIYRSTNAGTTWDQVLFLSDSTAGIDVVINPANPSIVYAAMWERIRRPEERSVGGLTSGIHRSTDGGDTWTLLTQGLPAPSPTVGRIGLAIAASDPSILYAIYADHPGYFAGVYKTTNGGDSWSRVNDSALSYIYSSYGWYFGNIRVDPTDPDVAYAMGIELFRTTNGGNSWYDISYYIHVDQHALWIDPTNPNRLIDGHDGGVDISTNAGGNWTKSLNLPITQFYAGTIDPLNPHRLYGGTQDNGTPRTMTGALDDWEIIYGGDGFYVIVDPTNSNIIYAEYQYGGLGKSTNCGYSFNSATNGISYSDRRNWMTPVVMDPSDHNTLYYGTYRVYRTTDAANWWTAISGDLTDGPGPGNLVYHTITTIAVSSADLDVVYAGTDDANVAVTTNGGTNWTDISDGLPERWVTRIAVDPIDPQIACATLSGYRQASPLPHVWRTTNTGASWTAITSNLPEAPVNDIVIDPADRTRLYLATDVGTFYSTNLGVEWELLAPGMPLIVVDDLTVHGPERFIVAHTHGRSMYRLDLPVLLIDMQPDEDQVPRGGTLGLTGSVINCSSESQTVYGLTEVTLPNGNPYPGNPVVGPREIVVPPNETVSIHLTHQVPLGAPLGTYTYTGKIGTPPSTLIDRDSFRFKVVEGP
jgi:photosystem II stability/assembly factor-like uncharacterized protein